MRRPKYFGLTDYKVNSKAQATALKNALKKQGALLRKERLNAGMTQEELGNALGMRQEAVSMTETGRRRLHISKVPALAKLFPNTYCNIFQNMR